MVIELTVVDGEVAVDYDALAAAKLERLVALYEDEIVIEFV